MSKKIMIVEDEPDVMDYLQTVLSTHGFETVTCMSASESFDLAEKERPDLVCLDIMMPEETGISFYTRLKQNEELKDIPVIIVSGAVQRGEFDFRSYVPDSSIPEPDCYLEKPIVIDEFIETINDLIGSGNRTVKKES